MNNTNLNFKTILVQNTQLNENQKQKISEELLERIILQYTMQMDPFAPLSKLLPEHWNNIFFTAIKRNMFKKYCILHSNGKKQFIWKLSINPNAMIDGYINIAILAKIIREDAIELCKFIWRKNRWGNPYSISHKTINLHNPHEKADESCKNFIGRGHNLLSNLISDSAKREYILRQIYNYGMNLYNYGYEKALKDIANGYKSINQ